MPMRLSPVVACLSFMLIGCGKALPTRDLQITRADSSQVTFTVEVAQSRAELEKGLMGRQDLAPLHGMLFVFPAESSLTFWMKNTPLFLDMLFIDTHGKIVYIHRKARPFDETPIKTPLPAQYVLEIKGGEADAQHLQPGDQLKL